MTEPTREQLSEHMDAKFDELDKRISELADRKQDKFPKGALAGLAVTLVMQLLLLAYVAGTFTTQLDVATADRYRGQDATRDLALRDQRDANIETELLEHSIRIEELRQRIRALESGE